MKQLQNEIHKWQKETFKSSDDISKYNHLIKEIKELGETLYFTDKEPVAEEIADCCFLLFGIASYNGIDVEDAMRKKFKINKARKWGKPDRNGVVEHIKDRVE